MEWLVTAGGRPWVIAWAAPTTEPPGRNHGSLGLCRSARGVVLVARDGGGWEFPAGRPEDDESRLDTLRREVREEGCEVETADLLGYTTSRCLQGPEKGLALVRAHWACRVRAGAWQPRHEIARRREVHVADVLSQLAVEPGFAPMWAHLLELARQSWGPPTGTTRSRAT